MTVRLTGRVLLANGEPRAGVTVRVFDRDTPGRDDDDLTVAPGRSDADGAFSVTFAPSRYLDWTEIQLPLPKGLPYDWSRDRRRWRLPDLGDVYLPYLRFDYTFGGHERRHDAFLPPFRREFRLPELPPRQFRPSRDGFAFTNRFPGYFIPFSVPALPDIPSPGNIYGLCGGMCAAAYDFLLAGRPAPGQSRPPGRKRPLHRYLVRRQNDSLGPLGSQVLRFARWMALPDDTPQGVQARTAAAWPAIRALLDDGQPAPIGLVYVSSRDTWRIWDNHQALAYHYRATPDGDLDVSIYDPNHPRRDDMVIRCRPAPVAGAPALQAYDCAQWLGARRLRSVRGFFPMPYQPVIPPAGL